MAQWKEMQDRAKKLLDEGLSAIKSSAQEAEFLAESTANAARLHVDAGRKRFEMYRVLHDLGALVYTALKGDPLAQGIPVTPAMAALAGQAANLDESLGYDTDMLQRFSVVRGETGGRPRPSPARPKKAAAAKKSAAPTKKKAARKPVARRARKRSGR